jgi:hypothetical protein
MGRRSRSDRLRPVRRRGKMRKIGFLVVTGALALTTTIALASNPVTRGALSYNGTRNPAGCSIAPDDKHPTELRVDCRQAEGPAYVRYRYTAASGYPGVRDAAEVSMDATAWTGTCDIEWMVRAPHTAARTARITVSGYCHIRSVTWTQ